MMQFLHIISNSWVMLGLQIVQRRLECESLVLQIHGLMSKRRELCWLIAIVLEMCTHSAIIPLQLTHFSLTVKEVSAGCGIW